MELPVDFNGSEFLDRWIAALRSGTYTQAQGGLRRPEGFCCLGVACDVFDPTKWRATAPIDFVYAYAASYMPYELWRALPLEISQTQLSSANDHAGKTLNEIADMIEAARTDK